MKTWIVWYYRYKNYLAFKEIKADTAKQAIKKARIKNIVALDIKHDA